MSRNELLPEGMYWYFYPELKHFVIIIEKKCKYNKARLEFKVEK